LLNIIYFSCFSLYILDINTAIHFDEENERFLNETFLIEHSNFLDNCVTPCDGKCIKIVVNTFRQILFTVRIIYTFLLYLFVLDLNSNLSFENVEYQGNICTKDKHVESSSTCKYINFCLHIWICI